MSKRKADVLVKIGQVTYCGNNYGSVLQCLATQKKLKDRGVECVYMTRSETGIGYLMQVLEFRLQKIWKMVRYPQYRPIFRECLQVLKPQQGQKGMHRDAVSALQTFIQTHIRHEALSWKQLKQQAHSAAFDCFLSGSDQIWNARWFITNRLYFLRFAPRGKRVAWMPSLAGEEIPAYNRATFSKYIKEYAMLSVREESGSKVLQDLLHRPVPALADPVFLLSAEEWRAMAVGEPRERPYVLMFFIDKPSSVALQQARLLQQETDCEVIYFAYDHAQPEDTFITGGPEHFLQMIDRAQAVLTDSFHACVFSAILDTPFYAFSRSGAAGSKQMSRVKNLLQNLGIFDRYLEAEQDCSGVIQSLPSEQIAVEIGRMRQSVLQYMDDVVQRYAGEER